MLFHVSLLVGVLSDNTSWKTGTYIDPFIAWACGIQFYRQILKMQIYHANRYALLLFVPFLTRIEGVIWRKRAKDWRLWLTRSVAEAISRHTSACWMLLISGSSWMNWVRFDLFVCYREGLFWTQYQVISTRKSPKFRPKLSCSSTMGSTVPKRRTILGCPHWSASARLNFTRNKIRQQCLVLT
jgi:hypothetical protein